MKACRPRPVFCAWHDRARRRLDRLEFFRAHGAGVVSRDDARGNGSPENQKRRDQDNSSSLRRSRGHKFYSCSWPKRPFQRAFTLVFMPMLGVALNFKLSDRGAGRPAAVHAKDNEDVGKNLSGGVGETLRLLEPNGAFWKLAATLACPGVKFDNPGKGVLTKLLRKATPGKITDAFLQVVHSRQVFGLLIEDPEPSKSGSTCWPVARRKA